MWWTGNRSFAASIPLIAEFLFYLFWEKQLAPGLVTDIWASLMWAMTLLSLPCLPSSPERPPRRPRVLPQLDISLVLMALTRASFKSLQDGF